jgi:putative transposase
MITTMLNNEDVLIRRFKVRRLMSELGLICKQPGPHAYKQATVEIPDIPNRLNREFGVSRPDQAWCGDITYIWAGQKWSYLMDYYNRQRPHTFNDGMSPVVAEEKLKRLSGIS